MRIALKTCRINNKRYLGNKYKLLDFIKQVVVKECPNVNTVADIFAGTGAVASAFTDKMLVVNDILYSNYVCYMAWFGTEKYSPKKISDYILRYNSLDVTEENYMSRTFSNTFFEKSVCKKIGYIRDDIEKNFKLKKINARERALLITSLLYGMDKIANTCGHYDAYRKNGEFNKKLELYLPEPDKNLKKNQLYNMDANKLVRQIKADLVYIDPPYNSRQYCDAYHLLENVARWEKPKVFGVAKKMNRDNLKSDYCTTEATEAFRDLIEHIDAKYILLSYNNMAKKGNARSNARISDENIMKILKEKGSVKVFSKKYKSFTTGKSDIQNNEERLFLCTCNTKKKELIKSPLNYTGGKFKLLKQILPHFPQQIDTFIDLFCGGCNVGINIQANRVIFNDNNKNLQMLYKTFQKLNIDTILKEIKKLIQKYKLSDTAQNGYACYACNSGDGLQSYNRDGFKSLKDEFNKTQKKDEHYYIMLFVLILYSFNNQIRFNNKEEYNVPVGKRDFNLMLQTRFKEFIFRIQQRGYEFLCKDFREIDIRKYGKNPFVYVDPPYLITCATYNEKNLWTETDEKDLLTYLDNLNANGFKFALSNVIDNKGKTNTMLLNWIKSNSYRVIHLETTYANSNYHTKDKMSKPHEVLIVNYKE